MYQLSSEERAQAQAHGVDVDQVVQQLEKFETGFPFLSLVRPATIGDGIIRLSDKEVKDYVDQYDQIVSEKSLLKFVPASGAATRMFKQLFEYLNTDEINEAVEKFIADITYFAFYDELRELLQKDGLVLNELITDKKYQPIVSALLLSAGLNYGNLPKGLLAFHRAENGSRTPLEEHLVEGAKHARDKNGVVQLHFTVSPEHQGRFESKLEVAKQSYEDKFGVEYNISFSQQKKSTDTIAVDLENRPMVENDKLLFRPAGHGALLENLNELDADVLFIKNIDNVVPDSKKEDTVSYKKALAGVLVQFQSASFAWLEQLELGKDCLEEALSLLQSEYGLKPDLVDTEDLRRFLNRPVRVCGMVENTGEPGGGPFWADNNGQVSLQIAETAQIDLSDDNQKEILSRSTHFNPVDLVCGIRDFRGAKFDLIQYRNDSTGFITQKSRGGKEVKAMELPGLWNGAMADWITIFVEVPISTFNPVKSVTDLLKTNHQ